MYTLAYYDKQHDTLNANIDCLAQAIEQIQAASYYTMKTESIYNTNDEVQQMIRDYVYLGRLEDDLRRLLCRMHKMRDKVCMAKLRHPDFKL